MLSGRRHARQPGMLEEASFALDPQEPRALMVVNGFIALIAKGNGSVES
jgi:hypothetical protein